jgi:hypothetical protein
MERLTLPGIEAGEVDSESTHAIALTRWDLAAFSILPRTQSVGDKWMGIFRVCAIPKHIRLM